MRMAHHLVRHSFPGFVDSFQGSNSSGGTGLRTFHSPLGFPPYPSRFPTFSSGAPYSQVASHPANVASYSSFPVRSKISFSNADEFSPVPPIAFHRNGHSVTDISPSQARYPSVIFGHGISAGRDPYHLSRGVASFPLNVSSKSIDRSNIHFFSQPIGSNLRPVNYAEKSEDIARTWRPLKPPNADSYAVEKRFTHKSFTPRPAHQSDASTIMRSFSETSNCTEPWSHNIDQLVGHSQAFVQRPTTFTKHGCCSNLGRASLENHDIIHFKSENATDLSPHSRVLLSEAPGSGRSRNITESSSQLSTVDSLPVSEGLSYPVITNASTDAVGAPPCKRLCDSPSSGTTKLRLSLSVSPLSTYPAGNLATVEDDNRLIRVKSPSVALNLKLTEHVRFGVAEFMGDPESTHFTQSKLVNGGDSESAPVNNFSPPDLTSNSMGDLTSATA